MNDSLRTDVFVRYQPETIASACIYLSARKLNVPLPKSPSWFQALGVEEDDIKECCYKIICLYDQKKPNQEELEALVDLLRRKLDESKKAARESTIKSEPVSGSTTPQQETTPIHSKKNSKKSHKYYNTFIFHFLFLIKLRCLFYFPEINGTVIMTADVRAEMAPNMIGILHQRSAEKIIITTEDENF